MLFYWKSLLFSTAMLESRSAGSDTWMHVHEGLGLLLQKRWKLTHWSGRDGVKILHVTWTCQSEVKSYYSKASNNTSSYELQWHTESCARQKRNVPLEVIIVPLNMKQNNSDEISPPNMCVCHTHAHFHIHNLLAALENLPGFRSCAPHPIRNTNSLLCKATAPLIKSPLKFISLQCMHDLLIAFQWTNDSIRSALHLSWVSLCVCDILPAWDKSSGADSRDNRACKHMRGGFTLAENNIYLHVLSDVLVTSSPEVNTLQQDPIS